MLLLKCLHVLVLVLVRILWGLFLYRTVYGTMKLLRVSVFVYGKNHVNAGAGGKRISIGMLFHVALYDYIVTVNVDLFLFNNYPSTEISLVAISHIHSYIYIYTHIRIQYMHIHISTYAQAVKIYSEQNIGRAKNRRINNFGYGGFSVLLFQFSHRERSYRCTIIVFDCFEPRLIRLRLSSSYYFTISFFSSSIFLSLSI